MSRPTLVTPERHETLYHGSRGLYTVQAYIKEHKHLINEYLVSSEPRIDDDFSSDLVRDVNEKLQSMGNLLPPSDNGSQVFANNAVFFLSLLRMAGTGIRVSALLLTAIDEPVMHLIDDIRALVKFVHTVEACSSLAEVEAAGLLRVDFYSSMRQPIQFFGPRETAKRYAKGYESFLYAYDLHDNDDDTLFLDMDSPDSIMAMMRPGMPFHSGKRIPDADVFRICEMRAYALQSGIFARYQEATDENASGVDAGDWATSALVQYESIIQRDTYDQPELDDKELLLPVEMNEADLRVSLRERLHRAYLDSRERWRICMRGAELDVKQLDERTLNTQFIDKVVRYLKICDIASSADMHHTTLHGILKRDGAALHSAIVAELNDSRAREERMRQKMKKRAFVPATAEENEAAIAAHKVTATDVVRKVADIDRATLVLTKDNGYNMNSFIRGIESDRMHLDAKNTDRRAKLLPMLVDAIERFGLVDGEAGDEVRGLVADLQGTDDIASKLDIRDFRERWDDYFKVALLSPRGIWMVMFVKWLTGKETKPGRWSMYSIDTLVIHVLIRSTWFESNDRIIGWRSASMEEWMVVHPERHGTMRKVKEGHDVAWATPLDPFKLQSVPVGTAGRASVSN